MKVSVNWIRNLNNLYKTSADPMPDGIDDLVVKIGAQLGAVDEVVDLGKKYEDIFVARVVSCEKHPNADKLSLCLIDDGDMVKKVDRNEQGLIQVVCGAPNVKAGMLVAWIPPRVAVPSTIDKDPFVLEAREIRGKVSNGMIASAKELAISEEHEGILVIEENIKPGTPFAKVYKLDDYIIDIENKMFTHRPDLFGQLGVARELAGIYGHAYKSPDWYKVDASIPSSNARDNLKLQNKNEVPKLVPRFCLLTIKDVKVGPSPVWLQSCLARVGVRPINNIVDLTNYYMLLTAQPLHAYDYDKVKVKDEGAGHATLNVRLSKKGEKLTLLGGKTIELKEDSIVIASSSEAIGLGGVMGGADTEVDNSTKNIILECGTFDMNTIRRTSMAYGLFTDAATRFTKGQSPLQNRAVIAKMAEDVLRFAGGRVSGKLIDDNHIKKDAVERGNLHKPVTATTQFINERLGLNLPAEEIKNLLENVEFKVKGSSEKLEVAAPFWRTDIEIPEDIVEEVGRLYGYDKLPLELPKRDLVPAEVDPLLSFKSRLRDILVQAGGNEVLTYSFVHGDLLDKVGQDKKQAYKISNALSPGLQYYRLSLTPSLLEKVHTNIKLGFSEFAIFEINKTHVKGFKDEEELPREFERIALVFAASQKSNVKIDGAAYYEARKYLMWLLYKLGIEKEVTFELLNPQDEDVATKYYEPARAATIKIGSDTIGRIGEYKTSVRNALKLPPFSAGFELGLERLLRFSKPQQPYLPLNRYPSVEQDITLRHDADKTYAELTKFLESVIKEISKDHSYNWQLIPLDVFQKEGDKEHKQTTWRILLSHPERTLTTEETNLLLDSVSQRAKKELGAKRV